MLVDLQTASFNDKTVTGDELGDSVDFGGEFYPGGGDQPMYLCAHLSAVDKASGDETYVVKWQSDDAVDNSGNLSAAQDIPGASLTFSRDNATDFKWVGADRGGEGGAVRGCGLQLRRDLAEREGHGVDHVHQAGEVRRLQGR